MPNMTSKLSYMKYKLLITIFLFSFLTSCQNNENLNPVLYFIGDSHIANWDIEASFPNHIGINQGQDGIKIKDIVNIQTTENCTIIIEIGTNDLTSIRTSDELEIYLLQYTKIINNLMAKNILILEVLPTNDINRNRTIESFNKELSIQIQNYDRLQVVHIYDHLSRNGTIRSELSRDGIHLNDYGYRIITNIVQSQL